jgi:hypothetical protein
MLYFDFFGFVLVLIAVSTTVFFPVRPLLVIVRFGASVQLVCSGLFPCHNDGSPAERVQEVDGGRKEKERERAHDKPNKYSQQSQIPN